MRERRKSGSRSRLERAVLPLVEQPVPGGSAHENVGTVIVVVVSRDRNRHRSECKCSEARGSGCVSKRSRGISEQVQPVGSTFEDVEVPVIVDVDEDHAPAGRGSGGGRPAKRVSGHIGEGDGGGGRVGGGGLRPRGGPPLRRPFPVW